MNGCYNNPLKVRQTTAMHNILTVKMIRFFALVLVLVLVLMAAVGLFPVLGQQMKNFKQKKTRSEFGKYLRGHVFKTTTESLDPQHCLADCWAEPERCESFNFLVNQNICQLNNRKKENAPEDFIDRDGIIYLTNPASGKAKKPQMPRHKLDYPNTNPDYCSSHPCQNGGNCMLNEPSGFLCVCSDGSYGPMCEYNGEHFCSTNSCQNNGTCLNNGMSYGCLCEFPYKGINCELKEYTFQGCFYEQLQMKVLPRMLANLRDNIDWHKPEKTVQECARIAINKQVTLFAIQYYGECYSYAPNNSNVDYTKYGSSSSQYEGLGGDSTNCVYLLN